MPELLEVAAGKKCCIESVAGCSALAELLEVAEEMKCCIKSKEMNWERAEQTK